MKQQEILHILRNPYGHSEGRLHQARLAAADLIEEWRKWGRDTLKWAKDNGLDITFYA